MDRNKTLISIKDAAEMLGVSVSTVRRWSDDGTLECYRIGSAGYRKYELSKVEYLKRQYYGGSIVSENPETPATSSKRHIITENISAEAHPAHYLMHKYWGRKAHNVVGEYISCFTEEGDTILEPFMGSGVTVIEAIKRKRKAIGLDINPMSTFIVKNTISNVDLEEFSSQYKKIIDTVYTEYGRFYTTKCPVCGGDATIETAIWENGDLVRIKGVCSKHNSFIIDAGDLDKNLYSACTNTKNELLQSGDIEYPSDPIMQYVKRSGRSNIDELFSDRALIILSRLRQLIMQVENESIRDLLLFCFTSMLSNVSRMIPGDKEKATYKSGWVISKFWTPKIHTERNIFMCMNLRYKAILKGKKELSDLDDSLAQLKTCDSSHLYFVENDSVDYIFTDPPYGESIAYLALSHFWNSWLPNEVNYDNEIIIDPYRKKGYSDYAQRTKAAYREFYRVLKDEHYMSFTFHNRDLNVWKAILDACNEAGFVLENIILQEQAVSSGTQGINKKNTLTGDFIYNFKKSTSADKKSIAILKKPRDFIKEKIDDFIRLHNGATPSALYEYLIPIIVQNNAYSDENGNAINIESILKSTYEYVEVIGDEKSKLGSAYKWVKK